MKILSAVLLPRWEEEVEEGEHSPSPQSSPTQGERKTKVRVFTGGKEGDFLLPRMLDLSRMQTGWIIVFSRETCYLFAARRAVSRLSQTV
jgi:hypothetical protein